MSEDGTRVRFISGLPEVTGHAGSRHHNPAAPPEPPPGPDGGFAVAHITGTSTEVLGAAGGLHAASVPIVYSPMLGRGVARGNRWSRGIISGFDSGLDPGGRGGAESLSQAGRIGELAVRVAAENEFMAGYLAEFAGIDRKKIVHVGMPPPGAQTVDFPTKGAEREGNLLVALCDDLTPEWNVLHLVYALEKINADAVIVSTRAKGAYADSCRARAELNPRVKLIVPGTGRGGPDVGEGAAITAALERAAILVDPSTEGLCYPFIASGVAAGIPAVISRRSVCRLSMPAEVELFEPSSWELLNHAVTTAFNRAAAADRPARAPAHSRARTAERFGKLYDDITRETGRS